MNAIRSRPWAVAVVVSLATFMEVLDTTIVNVSLHHIAGSLGAGLDESTWVLTSYLVANGIILPLSGWLSDAIGRKKFFIGSILLFTAASFLCGAATSLMGLVFFRILQGAAGGGLQPTQQSIILDSFPPEKRGTVFAVTGITMVFAPILGPTLGGLITDHFSWRWVFYINVPVGIIAAFMVWEIVEEPEHAKAKGTRNIDYFGLGLVSLGLAAMQVVLDKGQQEDWFASPFIQIWGLISFVCLVMAVIWLWEKQDPIIDLSLLKDRGFSLSCLLIFLTGFVLYGSNILLPFMLQSYFGYTSTLSGYILSPGGISVVFLMPVVAKLITRVEARNLILVGLALASFGMFHSMFFTPQSDFETFMWMRVTQVLGLPFLFIPISTIAFSNIPKHKSNKASALFALSRNLGGSVGIAFAATHVFRLQQVHQGYLSEHLHSGDIAYEALLGKVVQYIGNQELSMNVIYRMLQTQSALLSYIDTFELFGIMMVVAAILGALFLPSNNPSKMRAGGGH